MNGLFMQTQRVEVVIVSLRAQAVTVVQTQRVREGMLALPYGGSRNYMAQAVGVLQMQRVREGMLALPYGR